jgi:zinc transporter 10
MSTKQAIFYNLLSSVLCLFGMISGVLLGNTPAMTSWVFAAAAGIFIYIALVDMVSFSLILQRIYNEKNDDILL